MLKFNYLSLSMLLVSAPAWSMKFSAPINQLKLPVMLSTEQPPSIKHTPAGDITVSALRMCGDGDVEHFASQNTTFDFMPHDVHNLDVVVGYWVVEEGSSGDGLVPTQNNWFPVAYKKVPIAEKAADLAYEGRFLPITHAQINPSTNVMDLLKYDLTNLYTLANKSFESNKTYRIYAGAFGCHQPDGADQLVAEGSPSYDYKASTVESLRSLETRLPSAVDNMFASSNIISDLLGNKKLKIDLKSASSRDVPSSSPSPFDYDFGNHGIDLEDKAPKLYSIYKKIMDTNFPAGDLDTYKSDIAAESWKSDVIGYSGSDKIAYCNSVGATSDRNAKVYQNLEAFSMNLTCKNLYQGGALDLAFKELSNPASKPSHDDFKNLKKALAKRFFMAAAFESAQKKMDETAVIARSGCFKKPGQANLIGRLITAYPFNFAVENNKYVIKANANNHLHPESLFALNDFERYFASDATAIWGQVVPGQAATQLNELQNRSILLKPSQSMLNKVEETSGFNTPININFKVRSVGGSCTIFC